MGEEVDGKKDLDIEIEKLSLNPGDILVVTVDQPPDSSDIEVLHEMSNYILTKHPDVQILITKKDTNISLLNEVEMENLGWIRKEKDEKDSEEVEGDSGSSSDPKGIQPKG